MRTVRYSDASLAEAIALLRAGEVVAHATETCYGFACDLSNPEVVATLFAIKNRPLSQPVSALFASIEEAKRYVVWNDRAEELSKKYLPGPLTLILPLRHDTPCVLFPTPQNQESRIKNQATKNEQRATIGVRVSSHPVAHALIASFGSPLSTTSANLHGQQNPYSAEEMLRQFAGRAHALALILDSGALPERAPSTVVDLTREGSNIIRSGNVMVSLPNP